MTTRLDPRSASSLRNWDSSPLTTGMLLATILCTCGLFSQTLITDSLFAPALGRVRRVNVLLPKGFDTTRSYPALILLHGFGGDHSSWTAGARLSEHLGSTQIVLLMPDGENSWYVNSVTHPANRFEDYIADDIVRFGARRYRIDTARLAIGGLSMGGYGALEIGLRHSGRFHFIAGLSASLDVPMGIPELERNHREQLRPSLVEAFGADSSGFWKDHDLFHLIHRLQRGSAPFLYLANGIQDEFPRRLHYYRSFADSLRTFNLPYEYHEAPGRHNWDYWDQEIRAVLDRLRELFGL